MEDLNEKRKNARFVDIERSTVEATLEELKKYARDGKNVYTTFGKDRLPDLKIYPDMSLDDAYLAVTGLTRDEYFKFVEKRVPIREVLKKNMELNLKANNMLKRAHDAEPGELQKYSVEDFEKIHIELQFMSRIIDNYLSHSTLRREEVNFLNDMLSKNKIPFKNTIMGKITGNALKNWDGRTEEEIGKILSDEGLEEDGKIIKLNSYEEATNNKTFGSEVAAIKGLVNLISEVEKIPQADKKLLIDQLKKEISSTSSLSPVLAIKIETAMEEKGIESSIIEILSKIHDNWIKDNGKKFDDPKRPNKLGQFAPLLLMSFGEDGATADLLFLQPILEGANIEVDIQKLKAEFEKQQKTYMLEHGITDCKGLRKYLRNLGENYPTIQDVMTSKGKTINPPVAITDEIKKPNILERMVEQVSSKIGIPYEREVSKSEIADVAKTVREEEIVATTEEVIKEEENKEPGNTIVEE